MRSSLAKNLGGEHDDGWGCLRMREGECPSDWAALSGAARRARVGKFFCSFLLATIAVLGVVLEHSEQR